MAETVSRKTMTQTVDGKVTRKAKDESEDKGKKYWWKNTDNDDQLAQDIASTIKFIANHQHGRVDMLTFGTRLYGNSNGYNQLGSSFGRGKQTSTSASSRISFNLCAAVIDTIVAQTAKNKVVPTFITSGGVWGMQKKAENLSKFAEGIFYEQDIHKKIVYQARDAGAWGDGILHVYRDDKDRAAVERVLPHELLVDVVESVVATPRQMHRPKVVDRGMLLETFPDSEEDIINANPSNYVDLGTDGSAADLVTIAASWHLRSSEDATDGLYVVSLLDTGKILYKGQYDKDYFPFVILPYSKRLLGFWGQGVCERLMNLQGEINRLMILIQKSMWMGGSFKILSHVSDKVPTQHFNNEVGPIIKWAGGVAPQYIAPQFIQADIYPYIDSLIAKGFQQEGVSQLAASSLKPMGINSGTALRTYDNIAEDRLLFFGQTVEGCALEVTRQCIEIVKDVFKDKKKYTVNYPNTNFVESIDWKDVNLERDEYWLKAFPTSSLPEEPAAKLETVQEYMQAGLVSPRAGRRLLAMPDVEMSDKLANAAEELICKSIEDILYDGEDTVRPDGEWDLNLAKTVSLQYMNYAKLNSCPEERLALLRQFMQYVDDELGLTQPPPQAPPPGGPVSPMAQPTATPQSDLIPNVQGAAA